MRIGLCCSVSLTLFISVCSSRQITGAGDAAFFDSTSSSDAIRLTMAGVSVPSPGTAYFAWLVGDNDVQYTKLGQLTIQGNGGVLLTYRDNGGANLLATHKKLLITQESVPFSGIVPTLTSIR